MCKLVVISIPGEDQGVKIAPFMKRGGDGASALYFAVVMLTTALMGNPAANAGSDYFAPGNLVVSRSVYDNNPSNVQVGEMLPPNCDKTQGGCSPGATNDGTYPTVWNNALADGSFGITSRIFLDQLTTSGSLVTSLEVPNS